MWVGVPIPQLPTWKTFLEYYVYPNAIKCSIFRDKWCFIYVSRILKVILCINQFAYEIRTGKSFYTYFLVGITCVYFVRISSILWRSPDLSPRNPAKMTCSALTIHNVYSRPSNLPAKCAEEALRHKEEHARMVEAARRRVEREAAARLARLQQSLRLEERLARHAREWTQTILPDWQNQ